MSRQTFWWCVVVGGVAVAAFVPLRRRRRAVARRAKTVWTFEDAREAARGVGFTSEAEYKEYRCPGAYALPRDPVAAFGAKWTSWADYLGLASYVTPREGFEQVLFVEMGWGADQHGQDATKACVRAARNAIEFNSIPSIGKLVPGGYDNMRLAVELAVPSAHHGDVDLDAVAKVFPYGRATLRLQEGGALFPSGIALAKMGDRNDDIIVAVCCVTVGY
mmetsp:Transcript_1328/g.3979  ORF Transcript_1328/g.3979 Transcript_1328/m.3979 type:complete len:219 (+) Transcript_1328:217-873(+)